MMNTVDDFAVQRTKGELIREKVMSGFSLSQRESLEVIVRRDRPDLTKVTIKRKIAERDDSGKGGALSPPLFP